MAKAVKRKSGKKKEKKNIPNAKVFISATFNNTIVSVADLEGNVISWSSTGLHGFKGSRKSTPYAARIVGEDAITKALEHGVKQVDIIVKGPGSGRESALRAVASSGIKVNNIKDTTPVPHNGCRPPKRRRI
jgi:small subunit ribosomal protein S11